MNATAKSDQGKQDVSARLKIRYPDPTAVTATLGIAPDECWRAGDTRRGGTVPSKFGSWRLVESERDIPDDAWCAEFIERCLQRLLLRIEPGDFRMRLAQLDPNLRPTIVLTGSLHGLPNVYFPPELLAKIVALGAGLDQDFYPL